MTWSEKCNRCGMRVYESDYKMLGDEAYCLDCIDKMDEIDAEDFNDDYI